MTPRHGAPFRPARGAAEHVPRPGTTQPRWAGELARQLASPKNARGTGGRALIAPALPCQRRAALT
eukprot:9410703-Pyramimonas_sp.AAC.1